MKCTKCGGDYRTRELRCPYCGSENLLGKLWMVEKTQAELEWMRAHEDKRKSKWTVYDVNRILGRLAVVLFGINLFAVLLFIVGSLGSYGVNQLKKAFNKDDIYAVTREYYEAGQYYKMYQYMSEQDVLHDKEMEKYREIAIYSYEYEGYQEDLADFYQALEEYRARPGEEEEEDLLRKTTYLLDACCGILRIHDDVSYFEEAKSVEIITEWKNEILALLKGTFLLSEEEAADLAKEQYPSIELLEEMAGKLTERRYWESWVE